MSDSTVPPQFRITVTIEERSHGLRVSGEDTVTRIPCSIKRLADQLSLWMNLAVKGAYLIEELAAAVAYSPQPVAHVLCNPHFFDYLDTAQKTFTDIQTLAQRVGAPVVRDDTLDAATPYRLVTNPIQNQETNT